ncbi:MAG: hypothetical protein J7J20_02665 [Desulfurococcales archaeon]|nr:hypothetical protein [Desulfurococcales archaeon]
MRRYRCWHDIVESILKSLAKRDLGITELSLQAKLPVDRGKTVISYLVKHGLVIEYRIDERTFYRITERGYEWLGAYEYLKTVLPAPRQS